MPLGVYTKSNPELETLGSNLIRVYAEAYDVGNWRRVIIENGEAILQ